MSYFEQLVQQEKKNNPDIPLNSPDCKFPMDNPLPALNPLIECFDIIAEKMSETVDLYPKIISQIIEKHGNKGTLKLYGKYAWPITIILEPGNPYEIIRSLDKYRAIKPMYIKMIDGTICATGVNKFTNLVYKNMPVHSISYSRIVKFLLIMYEPDCYWKMMNAVENMAVTTKNALHDIPNNTKFSVRKKKK